MDNWYGVTFPNRQVMRGKVHLPITVSKTAVLHELKRFGLEATMEQQLGIWEKGVGVASYEELGSWYFRASSKRCGVSFLKIGRIRDLGDILIEDCGRWHLLLFREGTDEQLGARNRQTQEESCSHTFGRNVCASSCQEGVGGSRTRFQCR